MEDFYSELENRGLTRLLQDVEYKSPTFDGWGKVRSFLLDIVLNGKSVYIEGDYDVDGLACSLILTGTLKDLGVQDLKVYEYRKRTHSIDPFAVRQCIQGRFDYFLVADSGSNDYGLLQKLNNYGVKVIVLDHHVTELSYTDFGNEIAIINTELESTQFKLSAGALCFAVMELLYKELGRAVPKRFASIAAVSLLADVMDMSDDLNRSIYLMGVQVPEDEIPPQVLYFKNNFSRFNARYISYWFSPRVNACFRAEEFSVLNRLFLRDSDAVEKGDCIEEIEAIYENSRSLVNKVSDVIGNYCTEMEHFVYANLTIIDSYFDVVANKLYNYTGLIANNLAERFGKTGIVLCSTDEYVKGSVRDQCGRNYLQVFQQLCFAGGHESAFGLKINHMELDEFMEDLQNVDANFSLSGIGNAPIIVNVDDGGYPDDSLIRDIARYNEFAGPGVPIVLMQKRMVGDIRERRTEYYYKYRWGDFEIQSDVRIPFGKVIRFRPLYSGTLKLIVQV